jgi:hypothetical protein
MVYRYCVLVTSAATSVYFLDASKPLNPSRFVSTPVCQDVTIQVRRPCAAGWLRGHASPAQCHPCCRVHSCADTMCMCCACPAIQWAGQIRGEVRTKFDTPAPGIRLTARLLGSSYVISTLTDDSGRYTLQLQSGVACDPVGSPEACLSQLVR